MERVTIRRALRAALDLKHLTVATAVTIALGCGGPAAAAPVDEAIGTPDQYSTAKARTLASTHHSQLVSLYDSISTCLPWVNVHSRGIGFRKPKWAKEDERFLATWILIDQKDDGRFGEFAKERRASAMFSRYGVDLLRRMSALKGVAGDGGVQGYGVVQARLRPEGERELGVLGGQDHRAGVPGAAGAGGGDGEPRPAHLLRRHRRTRAHPARGVGRQLHHDLQGEGRRAQRPDLLITLP